MNYGSDLQRSITGGTDTIVALGTRVGRSALAVIRMSGDHALDIARLHVVPFPAMPRNGQLCCVSHGGQILDRAIITVYQAPVSFTGEDMVEISTHGGHVVPTSVVSALIGSGAREALPGEFTRRAVLNGKLDIVQAEAIGDLIDARSSAMQQMAVNQLDGGLSERIALLRNGILSLESLLVYDVDFPEEDDGPVSKARVLVATGDLLAQLDILLSTIPVGQIVSEGAIVVIAGEPNVGKSSLFNALLGENRAIVTETPGTTRDAIEGLITAGKWPIRLIDTAGLRQGTDIVERLGIETSERYITRSQIVLACGDTNLSLSKALAVVTKMSSAHVIPVLTKSDLGLEDLDSAILAGSSAVPVSSATGEGLELLQQRIDSALTRIYGDLVLEVPVLTRARHIRAITTAREEISDFREGWIGGLLPASIAAVHLRTAATALETLIGAISVDDVLDRVFSSFCVGK